MSSIRNVAPLTPAAFLETERAATVRHELVGGQTHEMVGASQVHNLIAVALSARLHAALEAACRVYVADAKVRVGDDFYYPDVVVSKEPVTADTYFLAEPIVIVEILSPATEARDRLEKRLAYQRLPSLREYVLVAQDRLAVEVYRRRERGWELESSGADDALSLKSLGLSVPLDVLYRSVAEVVPERRD